MKNLKTSLLTLNFWFRKRQKLEAANIQYTTNNEILVVCIGLKRIIIIPDNSHTELPLKHGLRDFDLAKSFHEINGLMSETWLQVRVDPDTISDVIMTMRNIYLEHFLGTMTFFS